MARMSNEQRERKALQELLLSGPYSRSQQFLSETLARLHPELTIPMFSGAHPSQTRNRHSDGQNLFTRRTFQGVLAFLHVFAPNIFPHIGLKFETRSEQVLPTA